MSITIKNEMAKAFGFFYGTPEDAQNGGNGQDVLFIPATTQEVSGELLGKLVLIPQFREAVDKGWLSVFNPYELVEKVEPGPEPVVEPVVQPEPVVEVEPETEPEHEPEPEPVVVVKKKKRGRPRKK